MFILLNNLWVCPQFFWEGGTLIDPSPPMLLELWATPKEATR
jgi:hypothetical protein